LKSLPRANVWLDLFSPFTPSTKSLRLSTFGKATDDVRFLEDQDGAAAWQELSEGEGGVHGAFDAFRQELERQRELQVTGMEKSSKSTFSSLLDGSYNFVDIPLLTSTMVGFSRRRIKQFLTDFDVPRRLLEVEDESGSALDGEPIGELDIAIVEVAAGKDSNFLPACYQSLFEEGSILL